MYYSLGSSWDFNVLFTRNQLGFKCIINQEAVGIQMYYLQESSWDSNVLLTRKQLGFECIIY